MKRREQMTRWERLYLGEVLRGLATVNAHFMRNLALHIAHAMGFAKERKAATTVQYPDERKTYPEGYRGSHRLTLRPDSSVRCTACFLCATACPAQCIYIEAGAHPNPRSREVSAALRDRHAALHLLRPVRRGLPMRRDPDGHLRPSAHLGL